MGLLPVPRRHTQAHFDAAVAETLAHRIQVQPRDGESQPSASLGPPLDSVNLMPPARPPRRFSMPFRRARRIAALAAISDVEVYYGSLNGMAERFAHELANDVSQRGPNLSLQSLATFHPDAFMLPTQRTQARLFVFIVSTHFAGSPSPSAERFHMWLSDTCDAPLRRSSTDLVDPSATVITEIPVQVSHKASQEAKHHGGILSWLRGRDPDSVAHSRHKLLVGMQFAVFGVGDSRFLTFNAMAKFVDAKLTDLGASRLLNTALGDQLQVSDSPTNLSFTFSQMVRHRRFCEI
ncbi:hypothetical protein PINS_up005017 [Pythium insidiosum]|nr:hypothetical protein PINS_up005017 [Pythium insidiosum]